VCSLLSGAPPSSRNCLLAPFCAGRYFTPSRRTQHPVDFVLLPPTQLPDFLSFHFLGFCPPAPRRDSLFGAVSSRSKFFFGFAYVPLFPCFGFMTALLTPRFESRLR